MRKVERSFSGSFTFLPAIIVFIALFAAPASSTDIQWNYVEGDYIVPGESGVEIVEFDILDGGDSLLRNSTDPGTNLSEFRDNRTMFLDKNSSSEEGVGGFGPGDDVVRVHRENTGGSNETLNGSLIRSFSNDTLFADGGVSGDAEFNGDKGTSQDNETVLRDNGTVEGELDSGDFVVSEGTMNLTRFEDTATFVDGDSDSLFDGGNEAIIRHPTSDPVDRQTLEDSDTVLREGSALLTEFNDGNISFTDTGYDDVFESGNAIIRDVGDKNNILEEQDIIVTDGSAALEDVGNTNLSYYESIESPTSGFDEVGEPIYYEGVQDGFVNTTSTIRIGNVTVTSRNDSVRGNMDLGLETLSYIYGNASNISDNDIGRELQDVTQANTGYGSTGSFLVLEYNVSGPANNTWSPSGTGDQDVLIYDLDGTGDLSTGDVLIYDSNPGNDNITVEAGEEFNSTEVQNSSVPKEIYTPDYEVGFEDDGDGTFSPYDDNVSVNISYGGNWSLVRLAPGGLTPSIRTSADNFVPGGRVRFWNADGKDDGEIPDGLYVDVNLTGNVSTGDVRLGHWTVTERAGEVTEGDLDAQAVIDPVDSSDDLKYFDDNDDNKYDPRSGKAVDTGGRDAIVASPDDALQSADSIVRSGDAAMEDFQPGERFMDNDLSGRYNDGEAIVRNQGDEPDVLEDEDEVVLAGEAGLDPFSSSVWYVETGEQQNYEKGSNESIVYDGDQNGVIDRGNLSSGQHYVIVDGEANLRKFMDPPRAEGDKGLVYVDKNGTGRFNGDEDILELELLLNDSDTGLTGESIYNFADTTRHDGTGLYSNGDAIVNDTDNNSVYKDVFQSLALENIYTNSNTYRENLSSDEVDGGIELYRSPEDGEDTRVATLTSGPRESYSWSASGFGEDITNDTDFYLEFDAEKEVGSKVYGVRLDTTNVESKSGRLEGLPCTRICDNRIIDAHPPEFKSAMTGASWSGNRSERDKILLRVIEVGSGLNGGSFDFTDFTVQRSDLNVTKAEKTGLWGNGAEIRLTLNDTVDTNATPGVNLSGTMLDFAQNTRETGKVESMDGLRPLLTDVSYEDRDVDGSIDEVDFEFSEDVNMTSFDASGWIFKENGVPCLQVLTPGPYNSFCSTVVEDAVNVTSGNDSGLYVDGLDLSTMKAVNATREDVSSYELGGSLYSVENSTTGYGGNGSFVVYEFNTSDADSDGVWNPNQSAGDQEVLVYDVDGEELSTGDVLIYDERPSNGNIPVAAGEQFNSTQAANTADPYRSYNVDADIGFMDNGDGSYEPFTDNASVRVSYNSSAFENPNTSKIALAPPGEVPEVYSGSFVDRGEIGFWNTSGTISDPLQDGLYVDMDTTGNITDGDIRLTDWTLEDRKDLYRHRLTTTVDSQTAGNALNGTKVSFDSRMIGWTGIENLEEAYIHRSGSKIPLEGNFTNFTSLNSGKAVNISFNTSKSSFTLQESDRLTIHYLSSYEAGVEDLDMIEVNPTEPGGVFDGTSSMVKGNSSELEFNATALEDITGVGNASMEPTFKFRVLQNLIVDGSGNSLMNTSDIPLEDEAAPAVTEVHTKDSDRDAELDRLKLWFSEDLNDPDSGYSSAFNLSNGTIDSIWNREINSSELTLNVSSVGGTAFTPNITLQNNTVFDEHHNTAHELQNFTSVEDAANPVLLNAEIDPVKSTYYYSFIDFELSENVSGSETVLEEAEIDGKTVEFNRTDTSDSYTVNYSDVLGTGDNPNITSVEGLNDAAGNSIVLEDDRNVIVNTFRRKIVEGWNFVSFPIADQSTPEIEEVIDAAKVEVVWMKKNGSWFSHDPDAPEAVNDFEAVKGGRGYLFKATENYTMAVNINSDWTGGAGPNVGQANASLRPGTYNLVGQFQEYRQDADYEAAFAALTEGDIGRVYRQDSPGSLDLERIKTGNPGTTNHMSPGQAYWARIESSSIDSWVWGIPKR